MIFSLVASMINSAFSICFSAFQLAQVPSLCNFSTHLSNHSNFFTFVSIFVDKILSKKKLQFCSKTEVKCNHLTIFYEISAFNDLMLSSSVA